MDNLGSWVRIQVNVIAKYKSWVTFSVKLHLTVAEEKGKNCLECCSVISGFSANLRPKLCQLKAECLQDALPSFSHTWKVLKLLPSPAFFVETILCCGFRSAFKIVYSVWSMRSRWNQEKIFGTEHRCICYINIIVQSVVVFLVH